MPGIKEKMEGREISDAIYTRETCRNLVIMNMFLYLDSINANILVATLYYSSARCYHWGELGKGHTGSLCIMSHNCM